MIAKLNGRWEALSTAYVVVFESGWRQSFTWTNSHVSVRHVMEEKWWPGPTCGPGSAYLLRSPYLLELLSVSQPELTAVICQLHLCISKSSVTRWSIKTIYTSFTHWLQFHSQWQLYLLTYDVQIAVKTGTEVNPFLKIAVRNACDHRWQIIMNIKTFYCL